MDVSSIVHYSISDLDVITSATQYVIIPRDVTIIGSASWGERPSRWCANEFKGHGKWNAAVGALVRGLS